jgi:hypothetical protein
MLPEPLRLAAAAGLPVFENAYDANLIVVRDSSQPLDTYDGRIYLCWREPGGAWRELSCRAATRPGTAYLRSPMNSGGTACLVPGRNPGSHALGQHKGTPALVQVGKVRVWRDNDRDAILDAGPGDVVYDDATGVNVHECSAPRYLAGCVGVPKEELAVLLEAFRELQAKRPQPKVSLTLVERG